MALPPKFSMKIENAVDVKHVETLVTCINKLDLAGLKGQDAYPMFKCLEWLAAGVNAYRNPKPPESVPTPIVSTTKQVLKRK